MHVGVHPRGVDNLTLSVPTNFSLMYVVFIDKDIIVEKYIYESHCVRNFASDISVEQMGNLS